MFVGMQSHDVLPRFASQTRRGQVYYTLHEGERERGAIKAHCCAGNRKRDHVGIQRVREMKDGGLRIVAIVADSAFDDDKKIHAMHCVCRGTTSRNNKKPCLIPLRSGTDAKPKSQCSQWVVVELGGVN